MIAIGVGSITEIATAPEVEITFSRDPTTYEWHQERLSQFRALYRALKPFAAKH